MITLTGSTWNHARHLEPLLAASRLFTQQHPDVHVEWQVRPLDGRVEAAVFDGGHDLWLLDATGVAAARRRGLLLPLDDAGRAADLEALRRHSLGASLARYAIDGRQWALPVDATAQVAACRPDRIDRPPYRWADVIALAEDGRVLWPLRPADAFASFCSLAANIGHPLAPSAGRWIDAAAARRVLQAMKAVARHLPPACFGWGPIDVLEALTDPAEPRRAYCPLVFGWSNYSRPRYRPKRIAFGDMPGLGDEGPVGSMLGGAGIAVTARCEHPALASEFAHALASEALQRRLVVDHHGQPAHALAWSDEHANQACTHFFRMTRRTLELSWQAPGDEAFAAYAGMAGETLTAFVRGDIGEDATLRRLGAAADRGPLPAAATAQP